MSRPSTDSNYLANKNTGIKLEFFGQALPLAIVGFVGIICNSSICYITHKYRHKYSALGSKTAILLIMNSCFEILHESSHFLFLIVSGSGINFIPFKIAVIFQTHSVMGLFSILVMFSSLSLDRLIAAAFPIYYKNLNKKHYIYCHASVLIIVSCFILYRMIYVAIQYPDWPVTGNIADTLAMISYDSTIMNFLSSLYMYIPPLFCYFLLGLILISRKGINLLGFFLYHLSSCDLNLNPN
uniref:G_PROTEIN_RECEP_F1_2 domain-containing protein n=1 Tax=Meloidogyne incognita TaxID=6306 RepID=A0A914LFT9_MELIC